MEGQSFLCLAVEGLWADTKQQIIMSMNHYLYLYCIYKYIYIVILHLYINDNMKFQSFVDLCCCTVFPLRQSNHDTSPPPPQADRPDLHLITDTAKIIPSCRPFPLPKFEHIGSIRNLPAKLMSVSGHIVLQISQNNEVKTHTNEKGLKQPEHALNPTFFPWSPEEIAPTLAHPLQVPSTWLGPGLSSTSRGM